MAVRTSSQSGNTHSAPFAFGSAVSDGDELRVGNAAHAVTIDGNCTLGTSKCASHQTRPTCSATGAGSLPAGAYRCRIVAVGTTGEATGSAGSTTTTLSGSNALRVTLPALPGGASSWSVYLSQAGGAAGTERRYATGKGGSTTFDCASASWEDGTVAFGSAATLPTSDAVSVASGVTSHTGGWAVAAGVTVTLKGDFSFLGDLTLGTTSGGATLTFSTADAPAGSHYRLYGGTVNTAGTPRLVTRGTSGSKTVVGAGTAGNGAVASAGQTSTTSSLRFDAQQTRFEDLGTTSRDALTWTQQTADHTSSFADTEWLRCGLVNGSFASAADVGYTFADCKWTDSLATTSPGGTGNTVCLWLSHSGTNAATAARTLTRCSFDRRVGVPQHGVVLDKCVLKALWDNVSGSATPASQIKNSLLRFTSNAGQITGCIAAFGAAASDAEGNIDLMDDTGGSFTNPHWYNVSGAQTYRGGFAQFTGTDSQGDFLKSFVSGSAVTLRGYVIAPNSAGKASAALMTMFNNTVGTLAADHNTYCNVESSAHICEGGQMPTGKLLSYKSNLVWAPNGTSHSGAGGYKVHDISGTRATNQDDMLAPANATHNYSWNARAGIGDVSDGVGYNFNTSASPGADDIDETGGSGPDFVDSTRSFWAWAVAQGSAGATLADKVADGIAYLVADPSLIPGAVAWLRGGFAPTNAALRDAGHDGVTVGAVEGEWASPAPRGRRLRLGLGLGL